MKFINKIICLAIVATTAFGCDDYLDVNEDPNNPLLEQVSPDLMLAASQSVPAGTLAVTMNQLGNLMSGAWGGNVLVTAGPFDDEFRYNVTSTFYNGIWDNLMARTANYSNIINYESEADYTNHKAIAKILRAFYSQYLVDIYGDIPYFQRHQFTQLLQVPYDEDSLVYADILNEINEAVEMIDNASNNTLSVTNEDIIYGGDMSKWRKFANTLKLRVIVRQSNVIPQSEAVSALAGLTTSDFIGFGDAVTLNPGYANENNRQNPFYATYGFNVAGNQVGNTVVASEYSVQMLDGTNSGGTFDNRLIRLYKTNNQGDYLGIQQGQLLGDLPNGASASLSGLGAGLGVDQASDAGASMDLNIFTEAESFFLQAEAVTRGYISGSGLGLFNSGIEASFNLLGASGANAYQSAIASQAGFGYTGSQEQQIEGIITQKWLALSCISGIEGWIEQTRTGYPNAPLSLTQTSGVRPVKLLYPLSELQGNSANVPSQTTADAFNPSIFWDN